MSNTEVVIVGGGFAGLNAAKKLSNQPHIHVTLIDRKNHHVFQPLLYQVATAGLSPADIAVAIRSILAKSQNVDIVLDQVEAVDLEQKTVRTNHSTYSYDHLILACGATHSYFGNSHWAAFAPGLKNIEDATGIRKKILLAFEKAEIETDPEVKKQLLTFVLVGAGPTGVELAGSIAELSKLTLAEEFKHINPRSSQVILVEAGSRVLSGFDEKLSGSAQKQLEDMGIQIRLNSPVTEINDKGVCIDRKEWIPSQTVIWSAGVRAENLQITPQVEKDRAGRIIVGEDLAISNFPNVFVCGDMSHLQSQNQKPLPGLAAVAMQEGRFVARSILGDLKGQARHRFKYRDKGMMATIGRGRAVLQLKSLRMSGVAAWFAWLAVHIYYLIGFRNRLLVFIQWAWAYFTFKRGARLIVEADEKPSASSRPGKLLHT